MEIHFGTVRRALVNTLGELPDFNVYDKIQDSFPVPAIFVSPANPVVEYYDTRGGKRHSAWRMLVTVLVNRIEIESAQDELDPLTDREGPIFGTLQDQVLTKLGGIAQYTTVVRAERYGTFRVGNTDYYGVQFLVEAIA